MRKSPRLSLLALIVAAAIGFTACSDDGESSSGTTGAGDTSADTTAASGATSTLDPVVGSVDLGPLADCPFFTKADAEAFLGTEVGEVNKSGSQVNGETILAVCAYNDLSGVAENGVSVSAKLVPGSGANVQGDLLQLEQERLAGLELQTIEDLGDGARAGVFPGSEIKLVVVFTGEYELNAAAGPNSTLEETIELARETISKLPERSLGD
jgi:hypothetical protein